MGRCSETITCGLVTARKRSLGQGNIFRSVCQEFCPQGGSASVNVGIPLPHPPDQAPPWDQAPPTGQAPPGTRHLPSRHQSGAEHAGRYRQQAGGTHPTGMHSCLLVSTFPVDW